MHSLDSGCCSPTGAKRISGKKLVFLSGKSIWTKLVEIDTLLLFYFAGHLTTTFLVFAPENAGFRRLGYVLPHTLSPPNIYASECERDDYSSAMFWNIGILSEKRVSQVLAGTLLYEYSSYRLGLIP